MKSSPLPGGAPRRGVDLDATERWIVKRGTPHFIEEYNAAEDIFTRATPVLLLVFLVSMFGAGNLAWAWWQNTLAVLAGVAIMAAIWAVTNRMRKRPLLALPDDVQWPELAVFVAGPTALQLIFGGQVLAAVGTAASLLGFLVVLYLVTGYGIIPLSRWALVQMFRELQAVVGLLLRALPLLLLVVTFLFINAEVWEIAGNLSGPFFVIVVSFFIGIGLVFLLARLPSELDRLAQFHNEDELRALIKGTPAEAARPATVARALAETPGFTRKQQINMLLVALVSQALQIALVSLLIAAFFIALGLFAVSGPTIENWVGHPGDALATVTLFGRELVFTTELLKVAGFLASFSSLHFTVTMITDETYREEFFESVLDELHQTLAVRAVYVTRFKSVAAKNAANAESA